MAIERNTFGYTVDCDFCSMSEDVDTDDFLTAVADIKQQGWKVLKERGEWQHKCPCCQDDFA